MEKKNNNNKIDKVFDKKNDVHKVQQNELIREKCES